MKKMILGKWELARSNTSSDKDPFVQIDEILEEESKNWRSEDDLRKYRRQHFETAVSEINKLKDFVDTGSCCCICRETWGWMKTSRYCRHHAHKECLYRLFIDNVSIKCKLCDAAFYKL